MKRILVIGGTKFIGKAVADQLASAGSEVVLFNRGSTAAPAPEFEHIAGDVRELDQHADTFRGLQLDGIVHCIAYSEQDAGRARDAFEGLDCPLVVLSSQDCYAGFHGWQQGREVTDFPMDERSPLAEPFYWRKHGHPSHSTTEEYDKSLMTQVLMDAHEAGKLAPVVLRLGMVWGPRDPHFEHRHGDIIWHLLDERERMVMGAVEQAQVWSFGYIDNVAAAIVHALEHAAAGSIYNIGELKLRTKRRWADLFAAAAGRPLEIQTVPDVLVSDEAEPDAPGYHFIFDNNAFVRDTGFVEPVDVEEAISTTLGWARQNRDLVGGRPDYEQREAAARAFREAMVGLSELAPT